MTIQNTKEQEAERKYMIVIDQLLYSAGYKIKDGEYVAFDEDGEMYVYFKQPHTRSCTWNIEASYPRYVKSIGYLSDEFIASSMIKWEDSLRVWVNPNECEDCIIVNGIHVPAPIKIPLVIGTDYYFPSFTSHEKVDAYVWDGSEFDLSNLSLDMVHLEKENAMAHANAMLAHQTPE